MDQFDREVEEMVCTFRNQPTRNDKAAFYNSLGEMQRDLMFEQLSTPEQEMIKEF